MQIAMGIRGYAFLRFIYICFIGTGGFKSYGLLQVITVWVISGLTVTVTSKPAGHEKPGIF
jgi:hypothetical protein